MSITRLFLVLCLLLLPLFSKNPRLMALGGSGGVDSKRVNSVSYFESALAYDNKEPTLYIDFSIKSSEANILQPLNKMYIYRVQEPTIQQNYEDTVNGGVTSAGIQSMQNAINAIKELNKNNGTNMIEYISPDFSLFYRYRNMGIGLRNISYNYAYIDSIQNITYDNTKQYTNLNDKYRELKDTYLRYVDSSLRLKEYHISLNEFFLSYANRLVFENNTLLYGLSLKTISANYISSLSNKLEDFNPDTIYQKVRSSKSGKDKTNFSYNMSFIFIPSWTPNIKVGLAWTDINKPSFDDYLVDSKVVLSVMYSLNNYFDSYFESDLSSYKDIYKKNINKKKSIGLQFKLEDFSIFAGYHNNDNVFQTNATSFGFSIKEFSVGYRTINNFSDYYNGSLKNFGEIAFSFRKET